MERPCWRATPNKSGSAYGLLKLVVQVTTLGYCTASATTARPGASVTASCAFVPCSRPPLGGRVHHRTPSATSVAASRIGHVDRYSTTTPTASLGRRGARWAANALLRRGKGVGSTTPGTPSAGGRSLSVSRVSPTTAGASISAAAAATRAAAREAGFGNPNAAISGVDGDETASSTSGTVGWRRGEDWRSSPASAARRASRSGSEGLYRSTSLNSVAAFPATGTELDRVSGEVDARGEGTGVVDDATATGVAASRPRLRFWVDLKGDITRRAVLYKSDWTDGLNRKSLPAILFLYFACLLPAVAFGGIASQVTQGTLGVIEYVVSCGIGGMAYAVLSGQPMTFIGPTGLTLAFMTALYSFTSVAGLPFLPVYSWVGLWTSGMLMALSVIGAPNLIGYATQFTDDVFNALLSVNFIFEACRSLQRNFSPAVAGYSQAGALMSMNVALATYLGCRGTSGARESRYLTSGSREFLSDFGPLMVIISMSIFCAIPSCRGLLSFLEVPSAFMLGKGRSWIVPMMSVGPAVRMASALPALLLTSLFFLDQNISARVVNSPRHKMVKGAAYHQDMLVLGLITGALSIVGLPWQCAATVQSLNHVRQMATLESTTSPGGARSEEIVSIHETRATGFCVHALVLGSLALLPQLAKIPMAVVSGIFLYLGRKVMSGNSFLVRVKEVFADQSLLSPTSDIKRVGFPSALRYTAIQVAMLALLWTLKSFKQTALFFPSVIGLLIIVRLTALPKMFSPRELDELDAAVG